VIRIALLTALGQLSAALLLLTACASPPAAPIAAAAGAQPAPAILPAVEPTLAPERTLVPEPTPTPERTLVPEPTPTPERTLVPEPTDAPPTVSPLPRYDLVLVGATLLDATGAPPLPNAAVAIRGSHIVDIGPAGALRYSADTPVRDVSGATLLPGFINAHVHITGLTDDDLRRWTRAGITTVRDLAGPTAERVAARERIRRADDPTLPRLLVAGPIVTVADGYPLAVGDRTLRVEGVAVQGAEHARTIISALADAGVDQIKIAVSGRSDVDWQELTDDEIAAITGAAHARGLRVSAHADRAAALERVVRGGIDDAAHSPRDRVPDEVFAMMAARGVTMTPTIAVYEALARHRGKDAAWRQQTQPVMYDNLRRFVAAGGILALGDDYGGVPDMPVGMPMAELLHWQAAGLSPQQIIEASTRGSAIAAGIDAELGTVEVGKVADLLVVQGDPLADLSALARPLLVIREGEIVTP
jgi:imidazolonepropionase-like amidohydrolase